MGGGKHRSGTGLYRQGHEPRWNFQRNSSARCGERGKSQTQCKKRNSAESGCGFGAVASSRARDQQVERMRMRLGPLRTLSEQMDLKNTAWERPTQKSAGPL